METEAAQEHRQSHRWKYGQVFLALVVITAIEVALTFVGLPRGSLTALFLLLSLAKAGLVASFYMHLRDDAPLYTWIFVLPAALLIVFAAMSALY